MSGSRAQVIGQVLIFILAGLIFILIISFGYTGIKGFIEKSEAVTLVDFQNELEKNVEQVKRDYGSVRKVDLRLPVKFSGVCFTGAQCPEGDVRMEGLRLDWIKEACAAGAGNVFLVPRDMDLSIDGIEIPYPYFACVPSVNGHVVLRMEGTGRTAKVSAWK